MSLAVAFLFKLFNNILFEKSELAYKLQNVNNTIRYGMREREYLLSHINTFTMHAVTGTVQ